jgi:hypothetical protein
MLFLIAALIASQTAPDEALARQLRSEIWSDILSNAWIGNGNELLAQWAKAGDFRADERPLHIEELLCGGSSDRLRCRFSLVRDGGVAFERGEAVPDRLSCGARFRRDRDGRWSIPRLPPGPQEAHSRITIRCRPTR